MTCGSLVPGYHWKKRGIRGYAGQEFESCIHLKVAIQSELVVRSVGRSVSQFAVPFFGQLFCPSVRQLVGPLFGL